MGDNPKSVAYVYDRLSNTNVPEKIGRKLSIIGGIDYQSVEFLKSGCFIRSVKQIYSADLVHTHHTKSAFLTSVLILLLALFKLKTIKRVHTVHRDISLLNYFSRIIYRLAIFPASDFIVCNSDATRKVIKNFTNKKSITTIYNGVDTNDRVGIINIGRLVPVKNQKVLIEAVSECLGLGYEIDLIIIGGGPEQKILQQIIDELNVNSNVVLLGDINHDNIPYYLKCSDIYVASSLSEGFGNATIEAALCGLPVIASKIDVHLEIGEGHFAFFDPRSSADLRLRLISYLDGTSAKYTSTSAAYFQRFSEDRCVSQHYSLYMDLLNENSS